MGVLKGPLVINSSLWCGGAQLWHTAFTVDNSLAGVLVTEHLKTCCASARGMRRVTIIGQGVCHICQVSESENFFPKDVFLFYFDSIDLKSNFGTRYRDGHIAAVWFQKKQNLKVTAARKKSWVQQTSSPRCCLKLFCK